MSVATKDIWVAEKGAKSLFEKGFSKIEEDPRQKEVI